MGKGAKPGSSVKDEIRLLEHLKFMDLVLEVLDARLPLTTINIRMQELLSNKKRLFILNKADLAEEEVTGRWLEYFSTEKGPVFSFNARRRTSVKQIEKTLDYLRSKEKTFYRPLRFMVVGIPNVGKSSVINRLAQRGAARTGERPGITRGLQWIKLRSGWDMLDTPGRISPFLRDKRSLMALGAIGSLEIGSYDEEKTAIWLLEQYMNQGKITQLCRYYSILVDEKAIEPEELFLKIGAVRGCLGKGGELDYRKTAAIILRDFRRGVLGRISLERPEEFHEQE